jgi:hypothetical protein
MINNIPIPKPINLSPLLFKEGNGPVSQPTPFPSFQRPLKRGMLLYLYRAPRRSAGCGERQGVNDFNAAQHRRSPK